MILVRAPLPGSLLPAGMTAYIQVEVCPEEPKKTMRMAEGTAAEEDYSNYEEDYAESEVITMHDEPFVPRINVRSFAKNRPATWTHFIAAEETDWDYAPIQLTYLNR